MKRMNGRSKFGYVWHFDDEERGEIYFSLAHQGESCASVARRYEVSPSVIRRVFRQLLEGTATSDRPRKGPGQKSDDENLRLEEGRSSLSLSSRERAEQAIGEDR